MNYLKPHAALETPIQGRGAGYGAKRVTQSFPSLLAPGSLSIVVETMALHLDEQSHGLGLQYNQQFVHNSPSLPYIKPVVYNTNGVSTILRRSSIEELLVLRGLQRMSRLPTTTYKPSPVFEVEKPKCMLRKRPRARASRYLRYGSSEPETPHLAQFLTATPTLSKQTKVTRRTTLWLLKNITNDMVQPRDGVATKLGASFFMQPRQIITVLSKGAPMLLS